MGKVFGYIEHLILAMIKGFIIMVIIAGIICFGAAYLFGHQLPTQINSLAQVFIYVIMGLAGALGAAVALIYRLSHIGEIAHGLDHLAQRAEAARQSDASKGK